MFWWLWSTRRKVTTLAVVLLLPVLFVTGRGLLGGSSPDAPDPSATASTDVPTSNPSSGSTVPGSVLPEGTGTFEQVEPLTLLAKDAQTGDAALESVFRPQLRFESGKVAMGDLVEGELPIYVFYTEPGEFSDFAKEIQERFRALGKVEMDTSTAGTARIDASGSYKDRPFTAKVTLRAVGAGVVATGSVLFAAQ